jgi:hypothetical protein
VLAADAGESVAKQLPIDGLVEATKEVVEFMNFV